MKATLAVWVSLALCAGLAFPATAVETPLTQRSVDEAVATGSAMARRGQGYALQSYVIYSADDSLRVSAQSDPVEAIALGTPFERLRYQAYLLAHQAKPFPRATIARFMASHDGVLEFVLFLHSRPDEGKDFLSHYGTATLSRTGEPPLTAERTERTSPVSDMYLGPGMTFESRWIGQITYRFRLDADYAPTDDVTFSYVDDRGVEHRYPLALAQFR